MQIKHYSIVSVLDFMWLLVIKDLWKGVRQRRRCPSKPRQGRTIVSSFVCCCTSTSTKRLMAELVAYKGANGCVRLPNSASNGYHLSLLSLGERIF